MLCACSWDRVVPESYLLQNTDENRMLMRKLTVISQKEWVLLLCCLVSFWMWTSTPHCFDTAGSSSWLIVAVIFKLYELWEGTVSRSQSKEASILWSHHEETRSCLEKEIMQGTIAHRRGRPRTAWMDNIKMWTGLPVEESVRMTEDRDKWRNYVHGVADRRIEDGYRREQCGL